jgi:hypothetical protein
MQALMCLVSSQDKQLRQKKRMMREATSGSTLMTCSMIRCSRSVKGWPPGSGRSYRAERRFRQANRDCKTPQIASQASVLISTPCSSARPAFRPSRASSDSL